MFPIPQNSSSYVLPFTMRDVNGNRVSGLAATVTVTLHKNGGSAVTPSGAITEIGSTGEYTVAGNATDTNTLGSLKLNATDPAGTAVDDDRTFWISGPNFYDGVRMGLTALPNATVSGVGGLLTAPTTANVGLADLSRILGTLLTETVPGYLAAALKKLFDVAVPVFTSASVNQTGDNFARIGVAGAGLTALGDTRIANLDAAITTRLAPTTAGRTLDVAATGEAGLDFDNIKDASGAHTLTNITVPTVTALTGNTAQTGDAYARLGAPAGLTTAADIAAVKAVDDAVKLKTDLIPASPAAVGSNMGTVTSVSGNVDGNVTGNVTGTVKLDATQAAYAPSKAGDAMALTSGERTTLTAAIWAALTSGLTTAGSIGKRIVDFVTTLVYAAPPSAAPTVTDIRTEMDANSTKLAYLTGPAALEATLTAIKGGTWSTQTLEALMTQIQLRLLTSAYTAPDNTSVAAVKAKTDQLAFTVANQVDANSLTGGITAAQIRAAVGLASANLDTQLDNLPTAAEVVTAMQAAVVEGTLTQVQVDRIILAACAGKASGLDTLLPKYRNTLDTKDRISAHTDAYGNRSAVTLDGS